MKFTFVAITAFCLLLCGCNSREKLEAQKQALISNWLVAEHEKSKLEIQMWKEERERLELGELNANVRVEAAHREEIELVDHKLEHARDALTDFDAAHPGIPPDDSNLLAKP